MRRRFLCLLTTGALALMIGLDALSKDEVLPLADGKPARPVLPLDQASSQTAFQTATFGLG